jgi:hypothetical protein
MTNRFAIGSIDLFFCVAWLRLHPFNIINQPTAFSFCLSRLLLEALVIAHLVHPGWGFPIEQIHHPFADRMLARVRSLGKDSQASAVGIKFFDIEH